MGQKGDTEEQGLHESIKRQFPLSVPRHLCFLLSQAVLSQVYEAGCGSSNVRPSTLSRAAIPPERIKWDACRVVRRA